MNDPHNVQSSLQNRLQLVSTHYKSSLQNLLQPMSVTLPLPHWSLDLGGRSGVVDWWGSVSIDRNTANILEQKIDPSQYTVNPFLLQLLGCWGWILTGDQAGKVLEFCFPNIIFEWLNTLIITHPHLIRYHILNIKYEPFHIWIGISSIDD